MCIVVKNHVLPFACAVSLTACAELVSTFNSCLGTEGSMSKHLLASRRGKVMCFKQMFYRQKSVLKDPLGVFVPCTSKRT